MNKHGVSEAKYQAIHYWLKSIYGIANKCENKKCKGKSHHFHWSLKKDKEYDFKRQNFQQLCVSCHGVYDTTDHEREVMRELNPNTHKTHCVNGHELIGANLLVLNRKGKIERQCLTCKRLRQKKWKRKKKLSALSDIQSLLKVSKEK